ncbi:MAG: chemotaxis protein CheW [Acidobacteria bacterium]|nr:chemotaxis protein CheW [Acidobacteriota bacterium]
MAENKDKNRPSLENPLVDDETVFEAPMGLPAWALELEPPTESDSQIDYSSLSSDSQVSELDLDLASQNTEGFSDSVETKAVQSVNTPIEQEDIESTRSFAQEQSFVAENSILEAPMEEPEFLQEPIFEEQTASLYSQEQESVDIASNLEEENKNVETESNFLESPIGEPEFLQQSSFIRDIYESHYLSDSASLTNENQKPQEKSLLAEIASLGQPSIETSLDKSEEVFTQEDLSESTSSTKVIEFNFNKSNGSAAKIGQLESVIANIDKDVSYLDFDIMAQSSNTNSSLEVARYLSFFLGGTNYAIAANNVLEMNKVPKITFVPNVTEWITGVTNLRGDILAVIDMRSFLGLAISERRNKDKLLVIRNNNSSLITGIIVDEVKGLREIPVSKIKSLPDFYLEEKLKSFFKGVYKSEEGMLVLLDIELFLASPDLRQFEHI